MNDPVAFGLLMLLAAGLICVICRLAVVGDLFTITSVYTALMVFEMAIYPLVRLLTGGVNKLGPYLELGLYDINSQFLTAFAAIVIHAFFLYAGYFALKRRPSLRASRLFPANPSVPGMLIWGTLLFLFTCYAVWSILTTFGSFEQFSEVYHRDRFRSLVRNSESVAAEAQAVVRWMNWAMFSLWVFVLVMFYNALVARNLFFWVLFGFSVVQLLGLMFLSGYRQVVMVLALQLVGFIYAVKGVRWFRIWLVPFLIGILCLLTAVTLAQEWLVTQSWGNEAEFDVEEAFITSLSPNRGFDAVAGLTSFFPDRYPFLLGESIWDAILTPVPRTFYPAKKEVYGTDWFNQIMGLPESTTTSITILAEYYSNYSFGGIAVFSLLQGLLMKLMDNFRSRNTFCFFVYYLGFFMSSNAVFGMGLISVAWMSVNTAALAIQVALVYYLIGRKRPRPERSAETAASPQRQQGRAAGNAGLGCSH